MTTALPAERLKRRRRRAGRISLDVVTDLTHHVEVMPGEIELLRSLLGQEINALFRDS